ncbi:PP2C family serine/threonine-protein phosphatase [Ruegeria sp. HKCCD6428]|uniref:PP2C family protein-serine/threonine phosphatase n=1 Tax=Ruegeria sp. HKCCD6428 TaxID=2683002 RepID=UPI001490BFAF|nr:protein phosphatase 2C domain-containing protein [Ruegeria sp. HKCCD6428]NOC83035.1 SpoIIE family protein phosphatase [Ruegeria sp. HKCCD6428]
MSQFRFSSATHVGKVRTINEDRILALPDHRVWVVADGMGGHHAGDFAAQTLVDRIADVPCLKDPYEQAQALRWSILDAHNLIWRESITRQNGSIGAAVLAVVATEDRFLVFWAGDSRLYRLRDENLQMLTADHSVVGDLVNLGELNWEEAEHHPQASVVTRAVGASARLEMDSVEATFRVGDRFLLCTDGLTNSVKLETQRIALRQAPIAKAADRLIQIALDGAGADNISVIVIDVI